MKTYDTPRKRLQDLFKSLVTAVALITLVLSGSMAANAAPPYDTSATVTDIKFTTSSIQDGSLAELTANWAFPANPTGKAGFTIALPPELAGRGDTFSLKASDTGATIATCMTTPTELQCDFDAAYVRDNPVGLNGSVNFWVTVADHVTSEQEKTYVVGGASVTTTITPRPVCTQNCELDFQYSKQGTYNASDNTIIWYVTIKAPKGGMTGGEEIVVKDIVSDNQTLIPARTGLQRTDTTAINPQSGLELPTNWVGVAASQRTISDDGTTISFTADQGYYYRAVFRTTAKDFGAAGTYTNGAEFTVNGVKDGEVSGEARYAGGGGTGIGTDVGVVTITKAVTGTATGLSADQVFTGTYTVQPPTGDALTGTWNTHAGETWRSPDFPRGSTVRLTEDRPTEPTNVTWTSEFSTNEFTLKGGEITPVTVTNTADVKVASFSIEKTISGNAAGLVPDGATFAIDYSYPAGVGFDAGMGTLTVKADGTPVISPDLPVGAQISLSEQTPAAVNGAVWGAGQISPETFVLSDKETLAVRVDNPIAEIQGGFSVRKVITGSGADHVPGDATFDIDYEWIAPGGRSGNGSVQINASGDPVLVDGLPEGAEVTLSERTPLPVAGMTWLDPAFSESSFTIAEATAIDVEVENPTQLHTGTFSVVKTVTGTEEALALVPDNLEYTIDYAYPAGTGFEAGEGSFTVLADGTPVTSPELPYGAQVTITERSPATVEGIGWGTPNISPAELTIEDGTNVAVTIENPAAETLGGFSIQKTISGTATSLVPDGTQFSVDYAWTSPDGITGSGAVTVTAGGDPEQIYGIPGGSVVTLSEHDPGAFEGVQWLNPVFSENGFSVVPGTVVPINLDNVTALRQGAFSVKKLVNGSGASLVDPETTFSINYSYPAGEGFEAGSGSLEVTADGTTVISEPLPYGAVVSLSEADPAAVKNGKWTGSSFDADSVTIGEGTVVNVILTNTIDDVTPSTSHPTASGLAMTGTESGAGLLAGLALLLLFAGGALVTRARNRAD